MEYYFRAEKMSVGYNKKPLIENMEIRLKKGEILTLIGPNGAGKSTVLKSIARQLELIGGTLYLGENSLKSMSGDELSKTMAVVMTERLRTEMMSCEDVVASGRYPYTGRFGILSEKDRRITGEVMDAVNISSIKNHDFRRISDGQRQRVMLARCLCQEPEIIILDEPVSYLDIKYKLEFLSLLQKMREKKGLTVIMSLHELELAKRVSDKILCINRGCVDRFGTPEEIFVNGYISKLFDISLGSMDEESGNTELPASNEEAKVFVIAGGGSGRKVYHRLQRQQTAFSTGIIFKNDLDYPAAKALAAHIIEAESFEPITEEHIEAAKTCLKKCSRVISCRENFGTFEIANKELLDYAVKCKKEIEKGY